VDSVHSVAVRAQGPWDASRVFDAEIHKRELHAQCAGCDKTTGGLGLRLAHHHDVGADQRWRCSPCHEKLEKSVIIPYTVKKSDEDPLPPYKARELQSLEEDLERRKAFKNEHGYDDDSDGYDSDDSYGRLSRRGSNQMISLLETEIDRLRDSIDKWDATPKCKGRYGRCPHRTTFPVGTVASRLVHTAGALGAMGPYCDTCIEWFKETTKEADTLPKCFK
jgi:hypothetical protein